MSMQAENFLKGPRFILIIIILIFLFFAVPYVSDLLKPSEKWSIDKDGLLSYPQNRGPVDYQKIIKSDNTEQIISKIIYNSKGESIYAIMRVPKTNKKMPSIIMLPGATVTKEAQDSRAEKFSKIGYITLTIDERGNSGETKGGASSMDDEFRSFMEEREPIQHKMVFDVLRAFDLLREQKEVDPSKILVFGESMGGRFAIIAGAVEPGIRGVIGVSTSGYASSEQQFQNADVARFFRSIDPDAYIEHISPRYLLMIHSTEDTVIPIDSAHSTFSHAKDPKNFITMACKTHGWCDEMLDQVVPEIDKMVMSNA